MIKVPWAKRKKRVTDSRSSFLFQEFLTVSELSEKDIGVYACNASNHVGYVYKVREEIFNFITGNLNFFLILWSVQKPQLSDTKCILHPRWSPSTSWPSSRTSLRARAPARPWSARRSTCGATPRGTRRQRCRGLSTGSKSTLVRGVCCSCHVIRKIVILSVSNPSFSLRN